MKPDALFLFVDNAAGGFREMVSQTAEECSMKSLFDPFKHYEYAEKAFCRDYCNWKSQYETKVTFGVWKKKEEQTQNTAYDMKSQFFERARHLGAKNEVGAMFTDADFPALDVTDGVKRQTMQSMHVELESARHSRRIGGNATEIENNQKCCLIM